MPKEEGAEAVRPRAGRRMHAPNGSVDFIMREGGVKAAKGAFIRVKVREREVPSCANVCAQ